MNDCLERRKSHICLWDRTSWGDYQCQICYEWKHEQAKCDVCKPFLLKGRRI